MKVTVVGAGLAGTASAFFLAEAGCAVTVIDRGAEPASETSHANGSMITPSLANPWNEPGVLATLVRSLGREDAPVMLRPRAVPSMLRWGLAFLRNSRRATFEHSFLRNVEFIQYSQGVMHELLQRHSLSFDHAMEGTLQVHRDPAALESAQRTAEMLEPAGVRHDVLDRAGVVAHEPALAPIAEQLVGGVAYPDDEVGNARSFCLELRRLAEAQGADFRFNESLYGLRGLLDRGNVVLAAGSYSPGLARDVGLDVPVRPAKGYSITVPIGDTVPRPRVPVIDDALHAAVVPLGNALRVAGTAEFAGFDRSVNASRIKNLKRLLEAIYPDLPMPRDVSPWCGLRPMTPDGMPIVGPSGVDGLFLNTGHGHLGWSMACASGKAISDLVTGQSPEVDLAPFSLGRDSQ